MITITTTTTTTTTTGNKLILSFYAFQSLHCYSDCKTLNYCAFVAARVTHRLSTIGMHITITNKTYYIVAIKNTKLLK